VFRWREHKCSNPLHPDFFPGFTGHGDGSQSHLLVFCQTQQHIRGIATGGDSHGYIAGFCKRFALACEHLIKPIVITDGREARRVYRQRGS